MDYPSAPIRANQNISKLSHEFLAGMLGSARYTVSIASGEQCRDETDELRARSFSSTPSLEPDSSNGRGPTLLTSACTPCSRKAKTSLDVQSDFVVYTSSLWSGGNV
jgi:hypothetical protein